MDRRKQLWLIIISSFVIGIVSTAPIFEKHNWIGFIIPMVMLLGVPVFACRYAVKDLGRESYILWFFLSMFPFVPVVLALEKPSAEDDFDPNQLVNGRPPESYEMGELKHIFKSKTNSYLTWKVVSIFIATTIGLSIAAPIFDKMEGGALSGILLLLFGVFVPGALFLWLIHKLEKRKGRQWVAIFSKGLVFSLDNNNSTTVAWSQIEEVWQDFSDNYVNGIRTQHRRRCKIIMSNGNQPFVFSEKIAGIEELTATIHHHATPFLIEKMESIFSNEKKLHFGKIDLSQEGIGLKNNLLSWRDLAGVFLDSGFVVIAKNSLSSGEARIKNAGNRISAFASRIVGTAQPFSPGGDAVIWKKVSIDKTPNPYTLTILVSEIVNKL